MPLIPENFQKSLIEGKSSKIALNAFLIATFVAAVTAVLLAGGQFTKTGVLTAIAPPFTYILVCGYLVFFVGTWFILYIQNIAENEDGFSSVRKDLVGDWIIGYTSVREISSGIVKRDVIHVGCHILINADNRKLELTFNNDGDAIFEDGPQTIDSVALRRESGNIYNMFYYFKGKLDLNQNMQNCIKWSENEDRKIEIEYFGKVSFKNALNAGRVTELDGQWYDLNGNISKLISIMNEANEASVAKAPVKLKSLADFRLARNSALMGVVEFRRGKAH